MAKATKKNTNASTVKKAAASKPKKTVVKAADKKVVVKKTTAAKKTVTTKKATAENKLTTAKKPAVKAKAIKKVAPKKTEPVKSAGSVKKSASVKKALAPQKVDKKAKVVETNVISEPKKVRKVKGYNKKELLTIKKIIMEKRNEIIEQLQSLKDQMMDPTTGQYVNENSPYSLHMAEQGTDAMEREKLYLWAQRENKFLGYLEDALQRIELGTYGICSDCIDEPQNLCPTCPLIPLDRLQAVPHTQHCLQIKQKMQSK
ncbi:MAG: conjugal transfer protein TraR [Bacteroidetes bacterium]|nr:conjugal transfer protein TraR [Bacteroidota bacterium]